MKVDLSGLLRSNSGEIDIDITASGSILGGPSSDITKVDDIRLVGKLTNLTGILTFNGRIEFGYNVACARCLKDVQNEQAIDVVQSFSVETAAEGGVEYTYSGKEIDFTKFVVDEVMLAIPARHLCNEDCKGLCPKCGVDLNQQQCSCKEENIDPRLEILGQLFK